MYLTAVADFCGAWEAYYLDNKRFYETEKFKKALLYLTYKDRLSCYIDYGSDKERVPVDGYQNFLQSSIFAERIIDEIGKVSFTPTYNYVESIFKDKAHYKKRLHEAIKNQYFNGITVQVRAYADNGAWIKAVSFDDFIKGCEKQKYNLICEERKRKANYSVAFAEYDISKTVYSDYMKDSTCEQEFGKKFFINLAFLLNLNATNAETLLQWNGYTMKQSTRAFDKICEKAFRIGFGRTYTIALIDKYNSELQASGKAFKPMPNLTKSRK